MIKEVHGWAFTTLFTTLFLVLFSPPSAVADSFDVLSPRFSPVTQSLRAVEYANGTYVAVGDGGTILTSADSVTWIPQVSGTTNRLNGIKYGTDGFVAVGDASTILESPDGIAWTQRTSPVTNRLSAVAYGAGRYVAVGTEGCIVTSADGVNWSRINTGAPYNLNGLGVGTVPIYSSAGSYFEYRFVAVGDSGLIMTLSTASRGPRVFPAHFSN